MPFVGVDTVDDDVVLQDLLCGLDSDSSLFLPDHCGSD
jgi:hypothetical protein